MKKSVNTFPSWVEKYCKEYAGKDKITFYATAQCECGGEILQVEYWDEEKEFCFVTFRYVPFVHGWKARLKFLFTGIVQYNEMIFSRENAKFISDYINTYSNEQEEEKQKG